MKKLLILLSIFISTLMVSCKGGEEVVPEGGETPDTPPVVNIDPNLNVAMVRATDTTITIGWTITESNVPYIKEIEPNEKADYSVDITKEYKVILYGNSACTNVVASAQPIKENMVDSKDLYNANTQPPRYIFTNLKPRTTYYVRVENLTDGTRNQKALRVATAVPAAEEDNVVKSNAKVGDLILFENFGGILYGGDMTSRGAGLSRTDRASLTSYDGANCLGEITVSNTGYYMVGADVEIGLFSTLKGVLDEMGIEDWGWIGGKSGANGGSVCARPGYVKIGTTANRSFIVTPLLKAIPDDQLATVEVVFKAVTYGSAANKTVQDDERYMSVKALEGATKNASHMYSYQGIAS